jgi:hypothetical protein
MKSAGRISLPQFPAGIGNIKRFRPASQILKEVMDEFEVVGM